MKNSHLKIEALSKTGFNRKISKQKKAETPRIPPSGGLKSPKISLFRIFLNFGPPRGPPGGPSRVVPTYYDSDRQNDAHHNFCFDLAFFIIGVI